MHMTFRVISLVVVILVKTRMHSSRMRTVRSSSPFAAGVFASMHAWIHAPLALGQETAPPPGPGPGDPPSWVWAWRPALRRPPQPDPPNLPPGYGPRHPPWTE